MLKAVAAAVGALAIQIFSGLAPSRATWNWTMDVPTTSSTCTVVPDSEMSGDLSAIYLQCSDADGGQQNLAPVEGPCINYECNPCFRGCLLDADWTAPQKKTTTPLTRELELVLTVRFHENARNPIQAAPATDWNAAEFFLF